MVVDGGTGNDSFTVDLGAGVAPAVLRGGDGADTFVINIDPTQHQGSPIPNRGEGAGGGSGAPPATPRLIIIEGGAGNDSIDIHGEANVVFATAATPVI